MNETDFGTKKLALAAEWSINPEDGDQALAELGGVGDKEDAVVMYEGPKCVRKLLLRPHPLVKGSLELKGQGGSLNAYFLPWKSRRILGVKLGDKADVFVTAGINGCSVFVTGDPASPTVYHAGVTGDGPTADMATYWRNKLKEQVKDKVLGEVNRNHYVFDGSKDKQGKKATKLSLKYENYVLDQHSKEGLRLKSVGPWGSFFGFRTGGKWAFYLQRNMALYYTRWRQGASTGDYITQIPISVAQVYPKDELSTEPKLVPLDKPFEIGDRVFALSTAYPKPANLDEVLKKARDAFAAYGLLTVRPEPLFAALLSEFKKGPTKAKAIALFDAFCDEKSPLRLRVDAKLLAPSDTDLSNLIQQFRDKKAEAETMNPIARFVTKGKRKPATDVFDAILAGAADLLEDPLAEFDVNQGAKAQLVEVESVQTTCFGKFESLRATLEKAGFTVKNIKA